jgi:hypothetical protein
VQTALVTRLQTCGQLSLALLVVASAVGCGSSGGGESDASGGSGGGAGASGDAEASSAGVISWQTDGVFFETMSVAISHTRSAASDQLQITGIDASGETLSFRVSTTAPPLNADTFWCDASEPMKSASFTYTPSDGALLVATECTISISFFDGTRASGSMSAVLPVDAPTPVGPSGTFNVVLGP